MFRSRTISKRLFALGGAWLTLAAGVQQTGALCRLVDCGCAATAAAAVAGDHAGCSHRHEDRGRHAAHLSSDHVPNQHAPSDHVPSEHGDEPAGDANGPCEHDCWYCQPPAPQQQPTSLDADALTQPTAALAASVQTAIEPAALSLSTVATIAAAPDRAVDVCARLCRFLV